MLANYCAVNSHPPHEFLAGSFYLFCGLLHYAFYCHEYVIYVCIICVLLLIGKPPSDTSDESVSSFGESEDDTLEDADIGLNSPGLPASELPEEEGGSNEGEGLEEEDHKDEITAGVSLASLQEDIEKGNAVKQQMSKCDGVSND